MNGGLEAFVFKLLLILVVLVYSEFAFDLVGELLDLGLDHILDSWVDVDCGLLLYPGFKGVELEGQAFEHVVLGKFKGLVVGQGY